MESSAGEVFGSEQGSNQRPILLHGPNRVSLSRIGGQHVNALHG